MDTLPYDALIIGIGAVSVRPPISGLDGLDPEDGVHLLHSMDDTFALARSLEQAPARRVVTSAPATSAWRWPRP
jgi:hypothetical protein